MIRRPPRSPLFPYPTLFRSNDTVTPQSGSRFLTGVLRASAATMVVVASHVCIVTETYAPEINGVASTLARRTRSEEHTSELQSLRHLVCRLLLEKKKKHISTRLSGACGRYHDTTRCYDTTGRRRRLRHSHDRCCIRRLASTAGASEHIHTGESGV